MNVVEVTDKDLPDDTTHGFKLVSGEETVMFFHWHDSPVEEQLVHTTYEEGDEVPDDVDLGLTVERQTRVSYADVLKALPERLHAMGYEKDIDGIQAEVIGRFGVGA